MDTDSRPRKKRKRRSGAAAAPSAPVALSFNDDEDTGSPRVDTASFRRRRDPNTATAVFRGRHSGTGGRAGASAPGITEEFAGNTVGSTAGNAVGNTAGNTFGTHIGDTLMEDVGGGDNRDSAASDGPRYDPASLAKLRAEQNVASDMRRETPAQAEERLHKIALSHDLGDRRPEKNATDAKSIDALLDADLLESTSRAQNGAEAPEYIPLDTDAGGMMGLKRAAEAAKRARAIARHRGGAADSGTNDPRGPLADLEYDEQDDADLRPVIGGEGLFRSGPVSADRRDSSSSGDGGPRSSGIDGHRSVRGSAMGSALHRLDHPGRGLGDNDNSMVIGSADADDHDDDGDVPTHPRDIAFSMRRERPAGDDDGGGAWGGADPSLDAEDLWPVSARSALDTAERLALEASRRAEAEGDAADAHEIRGSDLYRRAAESEEKAAAAGREARECDAFSKWIESLAAGAAARVRRIRGAREGVVRGVDPGIDAALAEAEAEIWGPAALRNAQSPSEARAFFDAWARDHPRRRKIVEGMRAALEACIALLPGGVEPNAA